MTLDRIGGLLAIGTCLLVLAQPATGQVGANDKLVNPNLAGSDELLAVPHLNRALVDAIEEGKPFLRMADLNEMLSRHLSEEQLAEVYGRLWVPINLNSATDAEVLLIPGVGARMLHEFDEYRPYRALAQFHREIDKYVDDDELARLEQYVFVPVDLNEGTEEAILSIPGIGSRMLREFREYRPYTNMAQFRREMGKYVDEDEVARMERYVIIN